MSVLAVTGHRPDRLGGYSPEATRLLERFAKTCLLNAKPKKVITGMAIGWDQAIARGCIDLRVPFIAAIPFAEQDRTWPSVARRIYSDILSYAKDIHLVCDGPTYSSHLASKAFRARNRWMVDNSTDLMALWDGTLSGTFDCIKYARKKDVKVNNVWDEWELFGETCDLLG